MRKQLCNVPELVRFEPMDRLVLLCERIQEHVGPMTIPETEPRGNKAIVPQKRPFLQAAFDDYVDQFRFLANWDVQFGEACAHSP